MSAEFNVLFLPYFAPSHLITMVDIARLFAKHSVPAVTIVTTPLNALLFQDSVNCDAAAGGNPITVRTLSFPAAKAGLPEGVENFGAITSMEMAAKLGAGISMLQEPMERLIREIRPHCIVSDMFFPWTVDIARELKIPRIVLYPSNFIYHCIIHSLKIYGPHENVESETEPFVIPGLPDKIEMARSQLPDHVKTRTRYGEFMEVISEAHLRSYGAIINSFEELEPKYVEHFRTVLGKKGWAVGPVSLFSNIEKNETPNNFISDRHSCMRWLDTQKPNSVLYICFGSMVRFSDSQLTEIALALEACKIPFVWVVRKRGKVEGIDQEEHWLPKGFEKRAIEGNMGIVIRDWAPQTKILEHHAIAWFLNHCGWNSCLESVAAGVPLITWPLFAEHFYNEVLVTKVLKIGVRVGSEIWNPSFEINCAMVGRNKIENAIQFVMGGSVEAEAIRLRAKELGEIAKNSVKEGGSAHSNLIALIDEIKACHLKKINT